MGRAPCCDKMGLKKGPWTPEEDQKLIGYIEQHGHGSWRSLPKLAGLLRCGKSCRLRWTNYLRPDIKRGKFSSEEEQTVVQLHAILGNRWSAIASHLPGRTDNEIKNYWNTHLKKRLLKMGIDPVTHKPKSEILDIHNAKTYHSSSLSHMAQWESARLEAEARLAKCSKLATSHAKLAELRHENNSTDEAFMRTLSIANTMLPHFQTSCRVGLSNFLYSWEQSLQGQSSNMFKLGAKLSPRSTLCSVDCSSSRVLMVGQKQEAERKPENKAMVKTEECEYSLPKVVAEEELMEKMSNLSTLLHDTHIVSDHESTCTTKKHTCLPSFNEGFPAELLMDIVEQSSTDTASTSCMNEATITSCSDQNTSELNGDDWSNLLKFVAP